MKQPEPRFCQRCGIKRRANPGGRHCWDCMQGGPYVPPPCQRCGTTEDFFASGLCARCHLHGSIRVDACPDCHAWGATRHTKWLCWSCANWRAKYPTVAACIACGIVLTLNAAGVCRLCRAQARRNSAAEGAFDVADANRFGAQLFLADMHKKATNPTRLPVPPPAPPTGRRPVTHRQLVLFRMTRDFTGGRGSVGPPRDPVLAAVLDAHVTDYANRLGWDRLRISDVRCGVRLLLGLQDTPGAAIARSELAVLAHFFITARHVAEVLADAGMLVDDRVPAIRRWFDQQVLDLPDPMVAALGVWFEVMHAGSTSSPRRRPRNETTIRIYVQATLPAMRRWASDGHGSLREITRSEVLAALPKEPARRKICGQAMRSIFGILKSHKLVFVNPATRLAHVSEQPLPPPTVDLDAVRAALASPDPARAAITALVAYHGLRSHHLRDLRLTDIRDRRLFVDGRSIPLAAPVRKRIAVWLDHRTARWPASTNPHLFIHFRTAERDEPVGVRWVFLTLNLPGGAQALRADRILHEATATGGDPRRLCDLFGLSIQHATRYTDAIAEPALRL